MINTGITSDSFYSHQSVCIKGADVGNITLFENAKPNYMNIRKLFENWAQKNGHNLEFVKLNELKPIFHKRFYGLHLLEVMILDGKVVLPEENAKKLHYVLMEAYLNQVNST